MVKKIILKTEEELLSSGWEETNIGFFTNSNAEVYINDVMAKDLGKAFDVIIDDLDNDNNVLVDSGYWWDKEAIKEFIND